mmetsp:Transcript_11864/g.25761  ORF Transcript_11864/g.25761 Transcript_11864/m.25761 type:complete len:351 (+) Transcript_11864:45-1097(+)
MHDGAQRHGDRSEMEKRVRPSSGSGKDVDCEGSAPRVEASAALETLGRLSTSQRFMIDLTAGAVAGLAADSVMHPVDTVKARMQANIGGSSMRAALFQSMRSLAAFRTLYHGIGAVLMGSIPTHAIVFSVFHYTKQIVEQQQLSQRRLLTEFTCAALGEIASLSTYVPSEVIAKRMQVSSVTNPGQRPPYLSSFHALGVISRTEGIRGLYTGLYSTAARDIPFTALQLTIFEQLKRLFGISDSSHRGASSGGMWINGALGGVAGGLAAAVTTPFDVAKTQLQTTNKYRGVWHCLSHTMRYHGFRGLFRGVAPRVLWVAPASAITLSVYERMVSLCSKAMAHHPDTERISS